MDDRRLLREIALVLLVKAVVLAFIWARFFAQPPAAF